MPSIEIGKKPVDFTREPVIETVITPREGCKLVVRSSKGSSHEEYFIDAVEVVSFGNASFFRSQEKPKNFLVPVIDYEVLEVREARMVLKHVAAERSIKIAGGRGAPVGAKEGPSKKKKEEEDEIASGKRKERRRTTRRKRRTTEEDAGAPESADKVELPTPEKKPVKRTAKPAERKKTGQSGIATLVPPPPTLISETISRYRQTDAFKDAFIEPKEELSEVVDVGEEGPSHPHIPPAHPSEEGKEGWDFNEALSPPPAPPMKEEENPPLPQPTQQEESTPPALPEEEKTVSSTEPPAQ